MRDRCGDQAIVLGGSIAGLLAARVLADVYDQVTVVDRDELAPGKTPRRGVPQARHIHALLARGQQVLEQLFPGLTAELVAHDAPIGDPLGDTRLLFGGHRLARTDSGLVALSVSRPLLEDRIRERVRALPQVRFAPPSDAVGLRCSPDGGRITGARLLRRADASAEEVLDADLVIDATGRGSRTPAWLQALGFGQPDVDLVQVDVGYVTRLYRLPADGLDGDLACVHGPAPDRPRGGALARLEGDAWMLTLFGLLGDHPPRDRDGFDAFARSLRFPDICEAVGTAEPLEGPAGYRFPANLRRRYERMRRFPEGFLVIGDAICSFNPIYGQGMTVAALQALALRNQLRPGSVPASRRLLRALARAIDAPWELAIGADLAVPGVKGLRTARRRIIGEYVTRLQAAAAHDPALARAFVRVTGLVDPPKALLRPATVARVLGASVRPADPAGGPGAGRLTDHHGDSRSPARRTEAARRSDAADERSNPH
jgi:2-polyprenyl-6-methoxyphenol hydroxylase-like FAD-dependent oxidoreductase